MSIDLVYSLRDLIPSTLIMSDNMMSEDANINDQAEEVCRMASMN